ncbi:MAG: hypothetical protein AAF108_02900 [Planctomycetota bacterium]
MSQLPTRQPTPLELSARADHASAVAENGCDALYRAGGAEDGQLIRVGIDAGQNRQGTYSPRSHSLTNQQQRRELRISMTAYPEGTDAGSGVTVDGEVIELKQNDTLEVRRADVGLGASGTIKLTILKHPTLRHHAIWEAEVGVA